MELPDLVWHHLPNDADTRRKLCNALGRDPEPIFRVLALSPVYPPGDPMRFRLMDPRFLGLCTEVTHFAVLD